MFREMRRKKQELSKDECIAVLERGTSGVLAVSGDDGYPYAVPLSYVYQDGKVYFHCAKSGHKLDAVARNEKASFCVIDQDKIVSEEFTTYFRSVILFGTVRILEDEADIRASIERLSLKYSPALSSEAHQAEIRRNWKALCMLELSVEHMTGKQAKELISEK